MERMNIEQAKRAAVESLKLVVAAQVAQKKIVDWLAQTTPEEDAEWAPFYEKVQGLLLLATSESVGLDWDTVVRMLDAEVAVCTS